MEDLERSVTRDEIRRAVWSCGDNKSLGPDGFTFEFFKKYWDCIGSGFCEAVEYFFVNSSFPKGCNSSFVAPIPKVMDAKFVNDFRPISLIGSVYKVVTKACCLSAHLTGIVCFPNASFNSAPNLRRNLNYDNVQFCVRKSSRPLSAILTSFVLAASPSKMMVLRKVFSLLILFYFLLVKYWFRDLSSRSKFFFGLEKGKLAIRKESVCLMMARHQFIRRIANGNVSDKHVGATNVVAQAEHERLEREYHSIRQTSTETSTEFMQRFLRLAGFLEAAAGTEEEQAKNFQWGLRRSTLNHLMCMSYMDVAQVANAARNYEILHERDDDDTERPDKR
nr:zinc finger, CCHC-type, retrotransposon Gag domain protein [Tanacetum cinerariifolium]